MGGIEVARFRHGGAEFLGFHRRGRTGATQDTEIRVARRAGGKNGASIESR